MESREGFRPKRFESRGEVTIRGERVAYTAIAADAPLYDDAGRAEATMFSFTYLRSGVRNAASRPVLFAWDGGPGSSSVWLHMGLLGPRRVVIPDPVHPPMLPPFPLAANANSLLDIADIVLIDPVGTGFSRMLPGSSPAEFYGGDPDVRTVVQFMQRWLTTYHRWNSPKFILGESYGATRAALVAKALMGGPTSPVEQLPAVSLNGVIVLGPEIQESGHRTIRDRASELPTMAATAWYHRKVVTKLSLPAFVSQTEQFADGPYIDALREGRGLSAAGLSRVATRMSSFIGIPARSLVRDGLRLSRVTFLKTLLRDRHVAMGMYDTRLVLPSMPRGDPDDPVADDPAMGQFTPAYVAAFNDYADVDLGISLRRRYDAIDFAVDVQWRPARQAMPLRDMSAAMRTNQGLRLFVGRGYYDMAVPLGQTDALLNGVALPRERVTIRTYRAGHMIYLGRDEAGELSEDLRTFIRAASPSL